MLDTSGDQCVPRPFGLRLEGRLLTAALRERAAAVVQGSPSRVGFLLRRAADPPLLHHLSAPGVHAAV